MPTSSSSPRGLDQARVRRLNTSVVLRALRGHQELATMQSLAGVTGLSRRTIELILTDLLATGWAQEAPATGGGGPGRPTRRFDLAADRRLVAGVLIDTHAAQAVVADLRGRVLGRSTRLLGPRYFSPADTVDIAVAAVDDALEQAGRTRPALLGGGVAAGGVVDSEDGTVLRLVNAPDWTGFPLAEALAARTTVPWTADNDANLAALAEQRDGVAAGRQHVAWLLHGQRTGAGFIVGGALHRGARGAAGELIESRVLALARDPHEGIDRLTSPIAAERREAAALVAAALAGDGPALDDARRLAGDIAAVIDVIAWTIAPELVVLGGGLEVGADLLIPLVRERLRELGALDVQLAASTVGRDGPVLGAVQQALDLVTADLFAASL